MNPSAPPTPGATTPEPETMRWAWLPGQPMVTRDEIIRWIKRNGGEARRMGNTIAVRTAQDWDFAAPGDTIVKGVALIPQINANGTWKRPLREFTVSSPEATT